MSDDEMLSQDVTEKNFAEDITLVDKTQEYSSDTNFNEHTQTQLLTLSEGITIGSYKIIKQIGAGGMGKVYKAYHEKLDKYVAIKVISNAEKISKQEKIRFLTEAKLTAHLKHPNIVTIHDVGEVGKIDYIVMDYIEGETLSNILQTFRHDINKALKIVKEVALAMYYAHESGIIHRDLKPANLIIEKDTQKVIVMDFGLAKNINMDSDLTKSGDIIGTPRYMAPEQASGDIDKINHKTDIYALGAILYEMITGTYAFDGTTSLGIIFNILNKEVTNPRKYNTKIGKDLVDICLKAMHKEQGKRYENAKLFAHDIDRYLKKEKLPTVKKKSQIKIAVIIFIILGLTAGFFLVKHYFSKSQKTKNKSDIITFANFYYNKASQFYIQKQYKLALENYNKAIKLDNKNARFYHDRGLVHYTIGNYKKSIEDNTTAMKIAPKFMDVYNNRALAKWQSGDVQGTFEDMDFAIKLKPNDSNLRSNKAYFYYNLKQYRNAITEYSTAIKINPSHAVAYYYRAYCYYYLKEYKKAIQDLKTYLTFNPGESPTVKRFIMQLEMLNK